jgi:hypothetical protein
MLGLTGASVADIALAVVPFGTRIEISSIQSTLNR